ncbi:long-chain fatty acid--CoA ligase [Rubrivivax gelatinosus]|nr:long-chain fatty acid--CoA ligase [Rubrivivax gelatinosus]
MSTQNLPAVDLATVHTLPDLLRWRIALTPEAEAYREHEDGRGWIPWSWRRFGAHVARYAAALDTLAPTRGARIAILLPNGVDAVTLDQAALARACVPLPMHALDNPLSIAYILADSGAELLVAQTEGQWRAIAGCGALPATLRQVVIRERDGETPPSRGGPEILSLADWLARGDAAPPRPAPAAPEAEDLAALVYTSGTTGKPKGVMLTHHNVIANVKAVLARIAPRPDDVFLSFLPLSHTFERTAGYYLPIAAGAAVAFARSTQHLPEDLKAVRPTLLISVPRIYERVFTRLQTMLEGEPTKRRIFGWAQAVGWRRFCREQGLPVPGHVPAALDALVWPLLRQRVGAPLQAQFGGRLRLAVSGGAALSAPIARCFIGLGLPIVQGYGMTESSPVVSCNTPEDNDPATVGRPLDGVEVRIGENRELLVRGANVMRGYWNRPEDTARALEGGWLHTGDQAAVEGGRIRIVGRVKEIIVTATGEKIAPTDLEMAIVADPLFEQAWAFGDNRPFIACIVVLAAGHWDKLARSLALDPQDPQALQTHAAREAALARIRAATASFPHYAQPRAVWLSTDAWTIESTMITPTLKLKRNNLQARYGEQVEALYRR